MLALCFRDYRTTHFMHAGLVCLGIGVLHAIPAGLLSWLVLRRGFAVDAVSAGLAAGTLAGLAGVGMLELHCPNFQAAHVLVWHLGVLLMSAGLGAVRVGVKKIGLPCSIRESQNRYRNRLEAQVSGNDAPKCPRSRTISNWLSSRRHAS